jgi:hypothetical protein
MDIKDADNIEPKDIIDACIQADNQLDDVFRQLHELVGTPKVFLMRGSLPAQHAMQNVALAQKFLAEAMMMFAEEMREKAEKE